MNWNPLEIEPRFYEIDSYNIVNNMYYLSWMEMGRLKIAKEAGIMIPRLYVDSIQFVVAETNIRYENAVNFWDKVLVETIISKVEGSRMDFSHRVKSRITKAQMAEANTSVLCLKQGKVIPRMPEWIQERIESYLHNVQSGAEK